MFWAQIAVGLLALLFGRQLFWLFVAAVGFFYGMDLAPVLFPAQPPAVVLLIALIAGLIGAVFAYFLQWLAVAVAGFLVGGRLAVLILGGIGSSMAAAPSIPFLVGGVIGAIVLLLFFNWTLIVFSSLIGAMLIAEVITAAPAALVLLVAMLTVAGIVIQGAWLYQHPPLDAGHPA